MANDPVDRTQRPVAATPASESVGSRSMMRRIKGRLGNALVRDAAARAALANEQRAAASLSKGPIILYSPQDSLAVLWSAKAASTFAVKWFFFQVQLLDEAMAYSAWPHHYREQIYCDRPGYDADLKSLTNARPRAIKFVRDPFARAVSAYLSFCDQAERVTHPPHGRTLEDIGVFLGRPMGDGESLSFREYVAFLGSVDLASADLHLQGQVHPAELAGRLPSLTLVRIEETGEVLPEVEHELGLRVSDIDALRESIHHTKRVEADDFVGDRRFGRTVGVPIPAYRAFYDPELAAEVRRLYAEDCRRYRYELVL